MRRANFRAGSRRRCHHRLFTASSDVPFAPRRHRPDAGDYRMRLDARLRPGPPLRPAGISRVRRIYQSGRRGGCAPAGRRFQPSTHHRAGCDMHLVAGSSRQVGQGANAAIWKRLVKVVGFIVANIYSSRYIIFFFKTASLWYCCYDVGFFYEQLDSHCSLAVLVNVDKRIF